MALEDQINHLIVYVVDDILIVSQFEYQKQYKIQVHKMHRF